MNEIDILELGRRAAAFIRWENSGLMPELIIYPDEFCELAERGTLTFRH